MVTTNVPASAVANVSFLSLRDFGATSDITIANNATEQLGVFNVDDQTLQTFGNGIINNYNYNTTRQFKIDLKTNAGTPVEVNNVNVRFKISNKSGSTVRQYVNLQSQALRAGVDNLEIFNLIGEPQDKLILEVQNVSGASVTLGFDAGESTGSIPTTRFETGI